MRTLLSWSQVGAAGVVFLATVAHAQQPLNPYDAPPGAVIVAPPPAPPAPPAGYIYPAPPAYGYQSPQSGPPVPPPVPSYQQGYYLYPAPSAYPYYYTPRPQLQCASLCARRPVRRWDGVRRFSLGVYATTLGINQSVGGKDVALGGFGFHLRIRNKGHLGLEASQAFLHASYLDGNFVRDSFPFTLSMMVYLMPNDDARHFNIYGLGGFGLMGDSVRLFDEHGTQVTQDFTEFEAHLGLGAELRFRWFALSADVRALWLALDDSQPPASYYSGVSGGPIPSSSHGVQGRLAASVWF